MAPQPRPLLVHKWHNRGVTAPRGQAVKRKVPPIPAKGVGRARHARCGVQQHPKMPVSMRSRHKKRVLRQPAPSERRG